jgi:hypothetical protein
VHDVSTGTTTRVSVSSEGVEGTEISPPDQHLRRWQACGVPLGSTGVRGR